MRFVQVKQTEQVDLQALHRARDLAVNTRTRLICQMRGFCLEYGVTMRKGVGVFRIDLPRALADESNDLTAGMQQLVRDLWEQLQQLEARIRTVTREIEAIAQRSEVARRLETVPGIGPMGATALIAAVGDGKQFRRARDMSAWLGLVPAQYSTGGKANLLGISKRGNTYVRRLLIHGARSCVIHLDRSRDRLGRWLDGLQRRMPVNKVVVALANKLARVAWVILTRPGALYERRDPQFA